MEGMSASNETRPDDGKRRLETVVRCLAVVRELCAEPLPTAGMVALAGQAVGIAERIAAELLREAENPGTGHPRRVITQTTSLYREIHE